MFFRTENLNFMISLDASSDLPSFVVSHTQPENFLSLFIAATSCFDKWFLEWIFYSFVSQRTMDFWCFNRIFHFSFISQTFISNTTRIFFLLFSFQSFKLLIWKMKSTPFAPRLFVRAPSSFQQWEEKGWKYLYLYWNNVMFWCYQHIFDRCSTPIHQLVMCHNIFYNSFPSEAMTESQTWTRICLKL